MFDGLSAPFALLTYVLCGVISIFGSRYLHREAGFNRFFVLYAVFVLGMIVTTMAGNIETLFTGWELVGVAQQATPAGGTSTIAYLKRPKG